ncbi:MAG: DUF1804 family protein [Geobacteraceae bacterium]|nr:DUF1804 family protein [Geobacteraceae bacterium]
MAVKGDRARLEDVAFRMYVDGHNLIEIEEALGVSRQTLSAWKARTKRPGDEFDEWDRAKEQKRSNIRRLKDLFENQLAYLEDLTPAQRTPGQMDTLSKLGALIEKWDKMERVQAAVETVEKDAEAMELKPETLDYIKKVLYGLTG